jgi:AmiR/NasT family two-component response regulator
MPATIESQTRARLLLADEDRHVLSTLGQGLRHVGFDVVVADSGEAALAAAREGEFDLAVLDVHMHGLSGIEVARQLLEKFDLHSLFLTAYSDDETVAQVVHEGGLGYLVKPVDPSQLVPAVEAALARGHDLRNLRRSGAQMEHALAGGRTTNVAVGLLMERHRLDRDTAFQMLRDKALSQSRRLEELANEVVAAAEMLNRLGGGR